MAQGYSVTYEFVNEDELPKLDNLPSGRAVMVTVERVRREITTEHHAVIVEMRYHGPAGA